MLLTPDEIIDLTDYQRPADQIRWLSSHGWHYEVGASGRPKVSRQYAETRMGLVHTEALPDFSSLGA